MATVEFEPEPGPDGGDRGPRPVDHRRPVLRGRLGGDDVGHEPEPRGHHHGRDPRDAEGGHPQPGHRLRGRARTSSRPGSTPRPASSTRSCSSIEGSLGNEKINGDGYWTGFGVNPSNGQPITVNEWVDRLRRQGRRGRRRRDVRDLRRHPGDEEQPDRRDGRARLPRLELEVQGRHPDREHPRLPGAAGQHDRDARAPRVRAGRAWARCPSSTTPAARCRSSAAPRTRAATAPRSTRRATSPRSTAPTTAAWSSSAARARWSSATCRCAAGQTTWAAARTWAASAWPARCRASPTSTCRSWTRTRWGASRRTSRSSRYGPLLRWGRHMNDQAQVRQGAGVAAQPRRAHDRLPEALVRSDPWRP